MVKTTATDEYPNTISKYLNVKTLQENIFVKDFPYCNQKINMF